MTCASRRDPAQPGRITLQYPQAAAANEPGFRPSPAKGDAQRLTLHGVVRPRAVTLRLPGLSLHSLHGSFLIERRTPGISCSPAFTREQMRPSGETATPGQRTRNGTRMPPSSAVKYAPRHGPTSRPTPIIAPSRSWLWPTSVASRKMSSNNSKTALTPSALPVDDLMSN
jgi:hypothetical protein